MVAATDPHDPNRFVEAQRDSHAQALAELRAGSASAREESAMSETSMKSGLWLADESNAEAEPAPGFENEGSPTVEVATAQIIASESEPPGDVAERFEERASVAEVITPLQPPRSVALYIDGDNQSPAIATDLLASVRHDWGLEVARAVLAGNDHGQSLPRWQAALAEVVPERCILVLRVPKTPEAADLALILELGAAMESHRQGPDLMVVVSRDEWLIGAAEAVRARGCRVWVAYAQSEAAPARTHLPTLLLPAVNRAHAAAKVTADAATAAKSSDEASHQPTATFLDQVRSRCKVQLGGGYLANEVGQALYQLGLTDKASRTRFLQAIPGLREVGEGSEKRLIF
jgi:nicotinic acid mononucleotide adenylyltransferase